MNNSQFVATSTASNYYFGGKLIKNSTGWVSPDRLGSIGKYFPYGQERPSATQDGTEKFATYFRDSETGLDYADQRYHQPGMGRFMTPDRVTGTPKDPASWNKYAYTEGDPINGIDPEGLFAQQVQLGADTYTVDVCSSAPDAATLWYLGFIGMTAWDVQQYCQGGSDGGTGFGGEPGGDPGGGGGGDPPPAPRPECDRGNETNAKILDFIAANLDAANKLSALTAQLGGGVQIPAGYLLAWAGIESGSGVDPAPVSNGNYFGLTLARGGITSGWIGAVPCGDGAWAGHACFNSADNFYTSGYAALFSHGDRNLDRLQQALTQPGATMASVFNSIASNAPRGSQYNTNPLYGSAIQNYFDTTLAPRLNCP